MWKEFKEFAVKGNAIDLAVGVIIGAAFGFVDATGWATRREPRFYQSLSAVVRQDYGWLAAC